MKSPPAIILVQPQLPENIGAVARAMRNFGFFDLRLVRPRDGWPQDRAWPAASGADEILDKARLYANVSDAVADLQAVFATAAITRDMVQRWFSPRAAIVEMRRRESHESFGILFGPERSGLTNDDLTQAEAIITIPTTDFYSLNLAQSVAVVAYEWFASRQETFDHLETGDSPTATQGEMDNFLRRLENELDTTRFFVNAEQRPTMLRNIRNGLRRARLTEQEVRTWHGILTSLADGPKRQREGK